MADRALATRIVVVSKRARPHPTGMRVVYIGRPSSLGNPFRVPREYDTARDPDDILGRYERWLRSQLESETPARGKLRSIVVDVLAGETVALECWCAPARCHGDVVRAVVLELLEAL